MEGSDVPWRLLTCTFRLVDVVREYDHALLRWPTDLMVTLAFDPLGRDLFEHWHYEDLHHHEDLAGLPAAVANTFETDWQNGPSFCDLQGTEALCVAKDHVLGSMAHEYVQLSTFVASECNFHGLHALLRNRN